MGQKVRPIGLRIGVNRTWDSRWFSDRDYTRLLHQDIQIREFIFKNFAQASISHVIIERPAKKIVVSVQTSRPGILIGKKGADIDRMKTQIARLTKADVTVNIMEIRKPELDAKLVADGVSQQIERRVSYKRAMKRAIQSSMRMGALGIKIVCSGRLGGAEIARTEEYREGRVPLHTLRADIDYGETAALTTYGKCGVRVWVYQGDILEHDPMAHERRVFQR